MPSEPIKPTEGETPTTQPSTGAETDHDLSSYSDPSSLPSSASSIHTNSMLIIITITMLFTL